VWHSGPSWNALLPTSSSELVAAIDEFAFPKNSLLVDETADDAYDVSFDAEAAALPKMTTVAHTAFEKRPGAGIMLTASSAR
jgi:hypothetical protein